MNGDDCPSCAKLREELATVKASLRSNLAMLDDVRAEQENQMLGCL